VSTTRADACLVVADQAATEQIARPRARRVMVDAQLRAAVVGLPGKRWSPEQVAHELLERFANQPDGKLCTEPIYQAIYDSEAPVTRPAKRRRRCRRRRSKAWNDVVGSPR